MKKVFEMEDLDCANCAAKMEDAIRKIEGVTYCSISFMAQRMTIEADDARPPKKAVPDREKVLFQAQA